MENIQERFVKLMNHLWTKGVYGSDTKAAEQLEIPRTSVTTLRTGRQQPTANQIEKICRLRPEFALWLCTGRSWPISGQTSPEELEGSKNPGRIKVISKFLSGETDSENEINLMREFDAVLILKVGAEERKSELIGKLK